MKIAADTDRIPFSEQLQQRTKSDEAAKKPAPPPDQPGIIDKVDLSSGFSLEQINSMMQTAIGKKVEKMFSDAGIEMSAAANLDWSPEATATRIVDTATGFLGIWRQQHPDQDEDESLSSFEKTIRGAINQGYSQALSMLGAANLDKDIVKSVAGETIDLVHSKLDDFFASLREKATPRADPAAASAN